MKTCSELHPSQSESQEHHQGLEVHRTMGNANDNRFNSLAESFFHLAWVPGHASGDASHETRKKRGQSEQKSVCMCIYIYR